MMTRNSFGHLFFVFAAMFLIASCKAGQLGTDNVEVKSVVISNENPSVDVGGTLLLKASVLPANATNKSISWSSRNTEVATVSATGVVNGLSDGVAEIVARARGGDISAVCTVSVGLGALANITAVVPVELIQLDESFVNVEVGEKYELFATIAPESATNKSVRWTTLDKSVATVENGVVTGVSDGTTIITAMSGSKKAICRVTVGELPTATSLALSPLTLYIGEQMPLELIAEPEGSSVGPIVWTSTRPTIADVDKETGLVTGVSKGVVQIAARSKNGTLKASTSVIVKGIDAESIVLDKNSLTMKPAEVAQLRATISPDDATCKDAKWESSDEKVASINANGWVTANSDGTAVISASPKDGSDVPPATCTVTVKSDATLAESVEILQGKILQDKKLTLKVGRTLALQAVVKPDETTNKMLNWKTSDESVVSVDLAGNIDANKVGEATITVETTDGSEKSAEIKVAVLSNFVEVTEMTLNKTSVNLQLLETGGSNSFSLAVASIEPDNASTKRVSWTSSDENVVAIETTSDPMCVNVRVRDSGIAKVTASAIDGSGVKATCDVSVTSNFVRFNLDLQGGEGKTEATLQKSETFSSLYGADFVPSKDGYLFEGWTTEAQAIAKNCDSGETVSAKFGDEYVSKGTLYAVWLKKVALGSLDEKFKAGAVVIASKGEPVELFDANHELVDVSGTKRYETNADGYFDVYIRKGSHYVVKYYCACVYNGSWKIGLADLGNIWDVDNNLDADDFAVAQVMFGKTGYVWDVGGRAFNIAWCANDLSKDWSASKDAAVEEATFPCYFMKKDGNLNIR